MGDVVRVARRRRVEVREFGRVGLTDDHGARETQCGDDLCIGRCRRAVYAQLTVCQSRHAGNVDDVLDADWNAVQRPAKTPRTSLAVEQIGFRPCTVVGDVAQACTTGSISSMRDRQCSTSALTLSAPKRITILQLGNSACIGRVVDLLQHYTEPSLKPLRPETYLANSGASGRKLRGTMAIRPQPARFEAIAEGPLPLGSIWLRGEGRCEGRRLSRCRATGLGTLARFRGSRHCAGDSRAPYLDRLSSIR